VLAYSFSSYNTSKLLNMVHIRHIIRNDCANYIMGFDDSTILNNK